MLNCLDLWGKSSPGPLRIGHRVGYLAALALSSTSLSSFISVVEAQAQSNSLVNVCAGLGVTLPHLTTLPAITTSFSLVNGLTGTLNGIVDGVNQGIVAPLSDVTLRVGVLDSNGNLVSVASPGGCNVGVSSLTLDNSKGLAIGGGRISGLGSLTAMAPTAVETSAIALGNNSSTALGSTDAIAIGTQASVNGANGTAVGLRAHSNATEAIALGTDANTNAAALAGLSLGARSTVSVVGGIALGSGSVATRAGLGGASEAFSGTVVGSTNGAVSVGTAGAERQITNVGGGTMATDAVNVRQLSAVGGNLAASLGGGARFDATTGTFTPPSYTVQGISQTTVGGAINALDLRLSATTTTTSTTANDLQQLQNRVSALPNLVQQDGATRVLSVGRTTDGTIVTIAGTGGDRRLSGLAAGTAPNDAVTLNQLRSAAGTVAASLGGGAGFDATTGVYQGPSYTVAGTAYSSVDRAIGALDGLSLQYVPGVAGTSTNVVDLSKGGSLGLVTLRSVAPGAVTSGSTEAVNGGQLYTTNQQLATNTFNLATLQNAFGSSSLGLLSQDPITRTVTVGAATNGSTIDISGTAGDRRIAGVAAGVNATDAVNIGQLTTALSTATGNQAAVAVSNQGQAVIPSATGMDALALGFGATASGMRSVAIGNGSVATQADTVSVGALGAERRIVNVGNGTVAAGSTDAVNGGQLAITNQQVASASSTLIGLRGGLDAGTVGLVQQDPTTRTLLVGNATDGSLITIAGAVGDRRLSGVANGTGGNDAVNLSQLRNTAGTLTTSLGGGAVFDPVTGAYQGPTYTVAGASYGSIDRAIGALDTLSVQYVSGASGIATNLVDFSKSGAMGLVTLRGVAPGQIAPNSAEAVNGAQLYTTNQQLAANSASISSLQNAYSTNGSGLVVQDPVTRVLTLGSATDGSVIRLGGTAGDRRVTGVAAGTSANDAVSVGQLDAALSNVTGGPVGLAVSNQAGLLPPTATAIDALAVGFGATATGTRSVAIGSGSVATQANTVSVGAVGAERRVVNVAGGTVALGSTDAVNGGQLAATDQQVASVSNTLTNIRGSLDAGTIGLVQQNPSTRTLTVGAVADGSVIDVNGSTGARRVTGVASGNSGSDAVNVDQLNTALVGVGTLVSSIPLAADNRSGLASPAATGRDSLAVGYGTSATAGRSIALGSGSVADQADTVSVGRPGAERRIVNVAAGAVVSGSIDAVNGGQLFGTASQLAGVFGGGARFDAQTGIFTAPTYTIRGSTYSDVGRAFGAVDAALAQDAGNITAVNRQIASLLASSPGTPIVQQPGGGVNITPQTGGTVVNIGGIEGPRTVSGVADGAAASDAVNVSQLNATTQSLSSKIQDFPVRANNPRGAARPVASGADAYASGYGASAIGSASVAIGAVAIASGVSTTAIGQDSSALADRSTSVGSNSVAGGADSAAFGQQSQATASAATAIGTASKASWAGATAIGYGAMATADPTTAVGYMTVASGNEASAFGGFASATADNSTALGRSASAGGTGATAVGMNASAQGTDSIAVGRAAQATHDNAIAIGAGAATSRANQVALGTGSQTYTLAGLPSAQSTASQSGPTGFVTTDASGNLAASSYGPAQMAQMDGRITTVQTGLATLGNFSLKARNEARQGIATALALSTAPLPSAPGKLSYVLNSGTFRGAIAGGGAVAYRLDTNAPLAVTAGVAGSGGGNVGMRFGIAGEL